MAGGWGMWGCGGGLASLGGVAAPRGAAPVCAAGGYTGGCGCGVVVFSRLSTTRWPTHQTQTITKTHPLSTQPTPKQDPNQHHKINQQAYNELFLVPLPARYVRARAKEALLSFVGRTGEGEWVRKVLCFVFWLLLWPSHFPTPQPHTQRRRQPQ